MTNPQIDYAAMAAQWRAERETTLTASRAELIAQLRAVNGGAILGHGSGGVVRSRAA